MRDALAAAAAALAFASAAAAADEAPVAGAVPRAGASAAEANPLRCDKRPDYPPGALRSAAQGRSTIEVTFDRDGQPIAARIGGASGDDPAHALLDQAALAAMSQCRLAHGEDAATKRSITYVWKLQGGSPADAAAMDEAFREHQEQLAAAALKMAADAEAGDPVAQLGLAKAYANGDGRPRDQALASTWCRLAAEAGNADAQVYWGQRLMVGQGVPQDDDAGIAWLRKAAAQGNGAAAYGLGLFARARRGLPRSDVDALRWFRQGAQAGNRPAAWELADAYARGVGTPRDDAEAARWLLAIAPFNLNAIYRLGLAYRDGRGVPVDYERAALCMAIVGRHGERAPTQALATIAPHLDAAAMARIQARADAWKVDDPLFP